MRRMIAKHLTTAKFVNLIAACLLKIVIHQFVNKILDFHCGEFSFFLGGGGEFG